MPQLPIQMQIKILALLLDVGADSELRYDLGELKAAMDDWDREVSKLCKTGDQACDVLCL